MIKKSEPDKTQIVQIIKITAQTHSIHKQINRLNGHTSTGENFEFGKNPIWTRT